MTQNVQMHVACDLYRDSLPDDRTVAVWSCKLGWGCGFIRYVPVFDRASTRSNLTFERSICSNIRTVLLHKRGKEPLFPERRLHARAISMLPTMRLSHTILRGGQTGRFSALAGGPLAQSCSHGRSMSAPRRLCGYHRGSVFPPS